MTTYSDQLAAISRQPIYLVRITLDYCDRTFGNSPCLATGTACYNTRGTCRYLSAWLNTTGKEYYFSPRGAPLPTAIAGVRPYLADVNVLPTEIDEGRTIIARATATFHDEPDTDVLIDPYLSTRSSTQGTFWKKLIARNPHYSGRTLEIFEGFPGMSEGEFESQQKFKGRIQDIRISGAAVSIEAKDDLQELSNIEIPVKLAIKLNFDITAAQTTITLDDVDGLDSPSGYVRIDDEIVAYSGVDDPANTLTGCTRGALSTTAATHDTGAKVQKVRYYAPGNPFNHLKTILLTDVGLAAGDVDTTEFDAQRDYPGGEPNVSAIITRPTKASELYFGLVDLLDCKSWVGEDLKVTIRRNLPNAPGRVYAALTDEGNIIRNSVSVDLNDSSRLTRVILYWDRLPVGDDNDPDDYNRIDVAVDPGAEGASEYNQKSEKKMFTPWLSTSYATEETTVRFIATTLLRRVHRNREARPILEFEVDIKDLDVHTGDFVKVSTSELLDIDGNPIAGHRYQVIKRERRPTGLKLWCVQVLKKRTMFIGPAASPDYLSATEAQREYGYICSGGEDPGYMSNRDPGYYIA